MDMHSLIMLVSVIVRTLILLDWTVRDPAERARVDRNTVSNIETGVYAGAPKTLDAIRRTLERAGVEFTNGDAPGARLRTK